MATFYQSGMAIYSISIWENKILIFNVQPYLYPTKKSNPIDCDIKVVLLKFLSETSLLAKRLYADHCCFPVCWCHQIWYHHNVFYLNGGRPLPHRQIMVHRVHQSVLPCPGCPQTGFISWHTATQLALGTPHSYTHRVDQP